MCKCYSIKLILYYCHYHNNLFLPKLVGSAKHYPKRLHNYTLHYKRPTMFPFLPHKVSQMTLEALCGHPRSMHLSMLHQQPRGWQALALYVFIKSLFPKPVSSPDLPSFSASFEMIDSNHGGTKQVGKREQFFVHRGINTNHASVWIIHEIWCTKRSLSSTMQTDPMCLMAWEAASSCDRHYMRS